MSEQDLIRKAMQSWNEGGFDAFAEHLAPDAVWHAPPQYPDAYLVFAAEDDLATEVWAFFDEARARAQAGL
jgi:hypothetical protein